MLKSFKGYSGKIKYDNEELRDIKEDDLYSKVYFVPQDSFIFKSSLYDNVTMFNGNSEGDKERFRDIIEKVNFYLRNNPERRQKLEKRYRAVVGQE